MGTSRAKITTKAPSPGSKQKVKYCVLCDGSMGQVTLRTEGIECQGYRCGDCGNEVVTLEQMKAYGEAMKLREILPVERKVIRMGNSVGITLPMAVSRFGLKVGSVVRVSYVTDSGFYVEPLKPKKRAQG